MGETLELYTVNDIAESLGSDARTIREYIKNGELTASKIGRKYIITQQSYKTFILNNQLNNKEEL